MPKEPHGRTLERLARAGKAGSEPRPAATVILLRDRRGSLETLMLRKNSRIAFGGMWVFPGGRVDEEDRAGTEGDEIAAARCAAVREAREEAGVDLDTRQLVPYSHWTPPPITPKRFLTWFFAAPAPAGEIVIDDGEIHEHRWMQPADALRRRDAGEIEVAPPTFVSLHELARHESCEAALAAARARTPERFETRIAVGEAGPLAIWHGDVGWPDGDPHGAGPRHRLCMSDTGWRYERSE